MEMSMPTEGICIEEHRCGMIPMSFGLRGGEQMCRQAEFSVQTRDSIQRLFGLITDSKAALFASDQPGMKRGAIASTLGYLLVKLAVCRISKAHYVQVKTALIK
jgi:hypothetical protein